jgi:hypothetical protein
MHGTIEPHVQTTLLTKTGGLRTIYYSSMLLHDPGGRSIGTLTIGADMIGQIEAVRARDHALQELQVAVCERQAWLKRTPALTGSRCWSGNGLTTR